MNTFTRGGSLREKRLCKSKRTEFSTCEGHASDHARILKEVDSLLAMATESNVSARETSHLATMIYEHGERFDSLYAKIISW